MNGDTSFYHVVVVVCVGGVGVGVEGRFQQKVSCWENTSFSHLSFLGKNALGWLS